MTPPGASSVPARPALRRPPVALVPPVIGLDARVLPGGIRFRLTNPLPSRLAETDQARAEVTFWKEDGTLVRTTFSDAAPATFPLGIVRPEELRGVLRTMGPDSVAELHLPANAWRPSGILPGVPLLVRIEKLVPVPRGAAAAPSPEGTPPPRAAPLQRAAP